MKKHILFLLLFILSACQNSDKAEVDQIVTEIKMEDLPIETVEINEETETVFNSSLHGVEPYRFKIRNNSLYVFLFSSKREREEGYRDFLDIIANMNLVSYETFQQDGILLFLVFDKSKNEELIRKINSAIDRL
ncbi:hypothetical protein [Salibacterium aidingense]|uniref:hypothetical protein n=1 Tax=Salibacterium aidingense TaxID=384933 RepID=UPI003BBE375D